MKNRPDVLLDKINNEAQEISALGTANAILPSLTGTLYTLNRAEAGGINPISPVPASAGAGRRFGDRAGPDFHEPVQHARRRSQFQRAHSQSVRIRPIWESTSFSSVRAI